MQKLAHDASGYHKSAALHRSLFFLLLNFLLFKQPQFSPAIVAMPML